MRALKYLFNIIRNTCLFIVCLLALFYSPEDINEWFDLDDATVASMGIMSVPEPEPEADTFDASDEPARPRYRPIGERVVVELPNGKAYIDPFQLIFIRKEFRYSNFKFQNEQTFKTTTSLAQLQKQLSAYPYFFKTKSSIVNINHIQRIESINASKDPRKNNYKKFLLMSNGDTLSIPLDKAVALSNTLERFYSGVE